MHLVFSAWCTPSPGRYPPLGDGFATELAAPHPDSSAVPDTAEGQLAEIQTLKSAIDALVTDIMGVSSVKTYSC